MPDTPIDLLGASADELELSLKMQERDKELAEQERSRYAVETLGTAAGMQRRAEERKEALERQAAEQAALRAQYDWMEPALDAAFDYAPVRTLYSVTASPVMSWMKSGASLMTMRGENDWNKPWVDFMQGVEGFHSFANSVRDRETIEDAWFSGKIGEYDVSAELLLNNAAATVVQFMGIGKAPGKAASAVKTFVGHTLSGTGKTSKVVNGLLGKASTAAEKGSLLTGVFLSSFGQHQSEAAAAGNLDEATSSSLTKAFMETAITGGVAKLTGFAGLEGVVQQASSAIEKQASHLGQLLGHLSSEVLEELLVVASDTFVNAFDGVAGNDITAEQAVDAAVYTVLQTVATVGLSHGPRAFLGSVADRHTKALQAAIKAEAEQQDQTVPTLTSIADADTEIEAVLSATQETAEVDNAVDVMSDAAIEAEVSRVMGPPRAAPRKSQPVDQDQTVATEVDAAPVQRRVVDQDKTVATEVDAEPIIVAKRRQVDQDKTAPTELGIAIIEEGEPKKAPQRKPSDDQDETLGTIIDGEPVQTPKPQRRVADQDQTVPTEVVTPIEDPSPKEKRRAAVAAKAKKVIKTAAKAGFPLEKGDLARLMAAAQKGPTAARHAIAGFTKKMQENAGNLDILPLVTEIHELIETIEPRSVQKNEDVTKRVADDLGMPLAKVEKFFNEFAKAGEDVAAMKVAFEAQINGLKARFVELTDIIAADPNDLVAQIEMANVASRMTELTRIDRGINLAAGRLVQANRITGGVHIDPVFLAIKAKLKAAAKEKDPTVVQRIKNEVNEQMNQLRESHPRIFKKIKQEVVKAQNKISPARQEREKKKKQKDPDATKATEAVTDVDATKATEAVTDVDATTVTEVFEDADLLSAKDAAKISDKLTDYLNTLFIYYINNLLANPRTQAKNILNTGFYSFLRPTMKMIGSYMTGNPRAAKFQMYQMAGQIQSRMEAQALAARAFRTGIDPFAGSPEDVRFLPQAGLFSPLLAKEAEEQGIDLEETKKLDPQTFNLRMLMASDVFFKATVGRGRAYARAMQEADDLREQGVSEEEIGRHVDGKMAVWFEEQLEVDRHESHAHTFNTRPGFVTKTVQKLLRHPLMFPGRLTLPFLNIQTNVLKEGVKTIPLLDIFIHHAYKAELDAAYNSKEYTAEMHQLALGRTAVGTSLVMLGMLLYSKGLLYGSYPDDDEEKLNDQRQGKIQNSVFVGDRWVSLQLFEPLITVLGMTADAMRGVEKGNIDGGWEAAGLIFNTVQKQALSKSWMKGAQQLMDLLLKEEGAIEDKLKRFVDNTLSGFVPYSGLMNYIHEAARGDLYDYKQDWRNFHKYGSLVTFGAIDDPVSKRDLHGREVKVSPFSPLSPFMFSLEVDDPVLVAISAIPGAVNTEVPTTFLSKKLTAEERDRLTVTQRTEEVSGYTMYSALKKLVTSKKYQNFDDPEEVVRAFLGDLPDIRESDLNRAGKKTPQARAIQLVIDVFTKVAMHKEFSRDKVRLQEAVDLKIRDLRIQRGRLPKPGTQLTPTINQLSEGGK